MELLFTIYWLQHTGFDSNEPESRHLWLRESQHLALVKSQNLTWLCGKISSENVALLFHAHALYLDDSTISSHEPRIRSVPRIDSPR